MQVASKSYRQSECVDEERCLPYNFRTVTMYSVKFKYQLSALIDFLDLIT